MEQNNQQSEQNQQQTGTPATNNQTPAPVPAPQAQQKPQPVKPTAAPVKQSKKNLYISGAVIIAVLALLIIVPTLKHKAPASDTVGTTDTTKDTSGCQPGFKFDIKTGKPCPAATAGSSSAGTSAVLGSSTESKALSRDAAQARYAGATVTITDVCAIEPKELTAAAGNTIMLDNNTKVAHTLTVGTKTYHISPLHYTLSWLNTGTGTLKVSCDGSDTGATVVVK